MHDLLLETLRDAQRFGFFGDAPIEEAVTHARAFVDAIGTLDPGARVVDLGSGGGLPGLVVAEAFRDAAVVLIDRREKRTDFLRRAVRRLQWDHVDVVAGDVEHLARSVERGDQSPFDVVTARGFGPPMVTLEFGRRLIGPSGRIVISEPPADDRWDSEAVSLLGLHRQRLESVSRFRRMTAGQCDDTTST